MQGFKFTKFSGKSENPFDRLFEIFKQLITHTSGDVAEALSWLTELDKEYKLTDKDYGIGDFIEDLKKKGYLKEDNPQSGSFKITAKTEQSIRKSALEMVFGKLKRKKQGNHKTNFSGTGNESSGDLKPYQFGDDIEHVDLQSSIRNAQINHGVDNFQLAENDLIVKEQYYKTHTSTVLMIDISHSMILYGEDRITPAKNVAMALAELIETRYPKDTLDIIVFGNDAWPIKVKDLPYLQVGPYHTNTVAGLELAMNILSKKKGTNKQIFMITDGKPSCLKINGQYYKNSFGLDSKIVNKCLNLASACRRLKIPITTFMIAQDPYLQDFVAQFTEANNGRAFFTSLQGLGEFIFEDFERNKKENFKMSKLTTIKTLGELKAAGYASKDIKEEMRANLISKLKQETPVFEGIHGYETTVIPDLKRAILSKHNISFLGLRGQAKTRIARSLTTLLDEYIPVLEGSELNEDPFHPLTAASKAMIEKLGDKTPISWMHRDERYSEKLATPDVSVADIIGDIDPIKAANLKLSFADERVIHYGMVPRSNRCIFVINEIPDLQARIQVALFNILQEGDFQIRGFKIRLPLDIAFVFTANPEDYTNRGSIVTPLKDRIGSQILTHYPSTREISKKITLQEAKLDKSQIENIEVPDLIIDLIEQIAIEARKSEFVDAKSGVSARLTIAAYENAVSAAELRMLMNGVSKTSVRITDLIGVIPAINGKIELVYEGETEGVANVAKSLLSSAIRTLFVELFPNPKRLKKQKEPFPYQPMIDWFSNNQSLELPYNLSEENYKDLLNNITGLSKLADKNMPKKTSNKLLLMEFILHGMAEYSLIHKMWMSDKMGFGDLVGDLISGLDFESE